MTLAKNKRSTSIPRNLRAKVKPWRQTQEQEIRRAMKLAKGDKLLAAVLLGIGKTTLYRRLTEFSAKHAGRKRRAQT